MRTSMNIILQLISETIGFILIGWIFWLDQKVDGWYNTNHRHPVNRREVSDALYAPVIIIPVLLILSSIWY